MSEPVHSSEIEDVLSSIRRLVAGEPADRTTKARPTFPEKAAKNTEPSPESSTEPALLLTAENRVAAAPVRSETYDRANPKDRPSDEAADEASEITDDPSYRKSVFIAAPQVEPSGHSTPDDESSAPAAAEVPQEAGVERSLFQRRPLFSRQTQAGPADEVLARPHHGSATSEAEDAPVAFAETSVESMGAVGSDPSEAPVSTVTSEIHSALPVFRQPEDRHQSEELGLRSELPAPVTETDGSTPESDGTPDSIPAAAEDGSTKALLAMSEGSGGTTPSIDVAAPIDKATAEAPLKRSGFAFGVAMGSSTAPADTHAGSGSGPDGRQRWAADVMNDFNVAKDDAEASGIEASTEAWLGSPGPRNETDAKAQVATGTSTPVAEPEAELNLSDSREDDLSDLFAEDDDTDPEASLRNLVARVVIEELQGPLGERITRNVRKLVRREVQRSLAARDFD